MTSYLAAVVQMTSDSDQAACVDRAEALIRRAANLGAQLVVTPEATNYLGPHLEKVRLAEPIDGPVCRHFGALADELGIHLLLGSYNERSDDPQRCFNTSVLFGTRGEVLATYRKIHLFDVDVSDQLRFKESDTAVPGTEPVVAETPLGNLGLSICYDMRFPELYRRLVDLGAQILAVPSAFTMMTGKDHWYPLLRARAIETQCYVIAAAQYGDHNDEGLRRSYGHSIVIDPWGKVVAAASDGEGIAVAEIDLGQIEGVRTSMPIAEHRAIGL